MTPRHHAATLERRLCSCGLHWLACPCSPDTLCPDCAAEAAAGAAHQKRVQAYDRESSPAARERHCARSQGCCWSHRQERLAHARDYYQARRERLCAHRRARYQEHRGQ